MRKPLVAVAGAAILLGLGWALLAGPEGGRPTQQSEVACDGRDRPDPGAPATLPLGLPMTSGATVLRVGLVGRTTVAHAVLPGTREDIVSVRDRVLEDLKAAGYTVVGTDQEPGFEAEAELGGTHDGTLQVSPLCDGKLKVRYKIQQ